MQLLTPELLLKARWANVLGWAETRGWEYGRIDVDRRTFQSVWTLIAPDGRQWTWLHDPNWQGTNISFFEPAFIALEQAEALGS